jgi:serine/threonine protein kinase
VRERSRVIGQVLLDRYTVQQQLGEGGMGVVYRAVDERGEPVAIKVLHATVASSPDLVARFQREADAQAMLSHPNIAALHAVGVTDDGGMFFVLELIEGHDLATVLDDGPLAPVRAVAITKQLLSGLHHAHQFGMIHRDLKPENVLLAHTLAGEQAKLIDFGLVKLVSAVFGEEEGQRLTRTGVVFGTPQYMSPEQMRGETVDPRSDLYAIGIMLCEMLTGRRPFEAEEVTELWQRHLSAPVPSLTELAEPRLAELGEPIASQFAAQLGDPNLDAIMSTLLAKRPDERFATAHAARRALDSLRWA